MRKKITFSLILAVCVVVLSFACVKTEASQSGQPAKTDKVITVANSDAESNPVLEARFLNMLNHNFVYNEEFYDDNGDAELEQVTAHMRKKLTCCQTEPDYEMRQKLMAYYYRKGFASEVIRKALDIVVNELFNN